MKKKDGFEALIKYYEDHMPEIVVLKKNHNRYDEVKEAIQAIANFAWETDDNAKVSVYPDDLTGTSICVTITACLFVIDKIEEFCEALHKADNFEVCPTTDGDVQLGFVFENVFSPVMPQ